MQCINQRKSVLQPYLLYMWDSEKDIFGYYIDRTAKAIKADLNNRFRAGGADITPEQWIILRKLYEQNGQSQVQLGETTYKDAPTTSRIIDLLCKKGYTERKSDSDDRRKFQIFITQEGRELVDRVYPFVVQSRMAGWAELDHKDYHELIRIVNKVFDNLR